MRTFAPAHALLALALSAPALALAPQRAGGEFSASGQGVLRIESELKLSVPSQDVEPVWSWLEERYRDRSWLGERGRSLVVTQGDELFQDTYFDDPDLSVLARSGGVRHRRRQVLSGPAQAKDGRQLLQLKLPTDDDAGIARGEIKFVVDPPRRLREPDDKEPVLGLIARRERANVLEQFAAVGLDARALEPVLTVEQRRRRVYLADADGALATLTLDECSVDDQGVAHRWDELELELNEVRYTEASEAERRDLDALLLLIERDILERFPGIVRDQTPKYVKAFHAIDDATVLPLATMHRLGFTMRDLWAGLLLIAVGVGAAVYHRLRTRRRWTADATLA